MEVPVFIFKLLASDRKRFIDKYVTHIFHNAPNNLRTDGKHKIFYDPDLPKGDIVLKARSGAVLAVTNVYAEEGKDRGTHI